MGRARGGTHSGANAHAATRPGDCRAFALFTKFRVRAARPDYRPIHLFQIKKACKQEHVIIKAQGAAAWAFTPCVGFIYLCEPVHKGSGCGIIKHPAMCAIASLCNSPHMHPLPLHRPAPLRVISLTQTSLRHFRPHIPPKQCARVHIFPTASPRNMFAPLFATGLGLGHAGSFPRICIY